MPSSGFKIKVGLDSTAAERGLANIGRSAKRLNKTMGRLAGKGMKLGVGLGAAVTALGALGAIKFLKDSSKTAADFEKLSMGLINMLGSSEAAMKRVKELQAFSVKTPFEPMELLRASKVLQALGGDTAAIGAGLTVVGDAASGMTRDLEVVATNVGLLFQGLVEGGEIGEAANQLMKWGMLTSESKNKMVELVTQAKKGTRAFLDHAQALEMIREGMKINEGSMARFSASISGKVSTMVGNFDMLKIAMGEGINKGLATGVDVMNKQLPKWVEASTKLGDAIGIGIAEAIKGNTKIMELQIAFVFQRLGEIAGAVFLQAFGGVVRSLIPRMIDKGLEIEENNPVAKLSRMFGLRNITPTQRMMRGVGKKAWGALSEHFASTPQMSMSEILDETRGLAGSGITKEQLDALIEIREEARETNKLLRARQYEPSRANLFQGVFDGLGYHTLGAGVMPEGEAGGGMGGGGH